MEEYSEGRVHKSEPEPRNGNGRFQKISIPIPRTAFWISEGEGGSTIMEFRGHGEVFTFGNPKAWGGGGSIGGIS